MKKQIYFLLIFICVNAYSQSNKGILCKKNTNHNPEVSCMHEEKADAAIRKVNNIQSKSTYYTSNNKEIPAQVFKYDVNGNVTEMLTYDEKGSLISKVVKEYDSKGNQISAKQFKNNILEESTDMKLNEFGNEIERTEKNSTNNNTAKVESIYDVNNNLIEQNSIGNNGSLLLTNIFKYDNNDRIIEKYTKSLNKIITRTTYKYDSKGLLTEQEDVDLEINHSMKYVMKYDESGNLIENRNYSSGSELYGYTYSYDSFGNNVETHYFSKGKLISILYDTFDKNNNKIEEVLKLSDGSIYSKTTYNYNKKNILTETVFWDPKTDQTTGKSINKFEYFK